MPGDSRLAKRLFGLLGPAILIVTALSWLWLRFNTTPGQRSRPALRMGMMGDLLSY